jgi:SAM-dependent methyltransferase
VRGEANMEGRFEFGSNWTGFLRVVDDDRILEARKSLQRMLEREELNGCSLLDAGSGSGLFSLAARQLGANVDSFDFDPRSVECTSELRARYSRDDPNWSVQRGSVLDRDFVRSLGQYDIVYSWGVLHHTGAMWSGLDNLARLVKADGYLYVALYNDQGLRSRIWKQVKQLYNRLPPSVRIPYVIVVMAPFELRSLFWNVVTLRPGRYLKRWKRDRTSRGMSSWHDIIDWVGGFPFEVARPGEVIEFCRARGLQLVRLVTVDGGWGCNEFVFRRWQPIENRD